MSFNSFMGSVITCLSAGMLVANSAISQHQSIKEVKISLDLSDVPPKTVLMAIERKTDFTFHYKKHIFEKDQTRLNMKVRNQSVANILERIAVRTGLSFRQVNNTIAVKERLASMPPDQGPGVSGQKHTVSGYVRDKSSGENLIGATIYDHLSGKGTTTNAYGFFSLTLPQDSISISVSFVGYTTQYFAHFLTSDHFLTFQMVSSATLEEVVVTAGEEEMEMIPQMSAMKLSTEEMIKIPVLMGEADVMKAIQLLPGIQAGAEGSSGVYVRGGGPDQNLILLDGVPMYNASHLFGFFSVFNPDAINNVEVIKGGFPARYGGRLSSVIDISMKEGNNQKLSGSGSIGLISAKLALEGPIVNEKTSFILSGRRTYLGFITDPFVSFSSENDQLDNFFFYDLNAKVNHTFSPRSRLYASFYTGLDNFDNETGSSSNTDTETMETTRVSTIEWGNTLGVVRWNYVFNPRLFVNISSSWNHYRYKSRERVSTINESSEGRTERTDGVTYQNSISDQTLKVDFDFAPSPDHLLKFGVLAIYHTYAPGVHRIKLQAGESTETIGTDDMDAMEYAVYLEDDIHIGEALRVNAGVHQSFFTVEDKTYSSTQPRISGRYLLRKGLSLKASYAVMQQFNHLLTNSGIGLPTDLWVPSTASVAPQRSRQVATGITMRKGALELTLEGYYKTMDDLIEYKEGATYSNLYEPWYTKIVTGRGTSRGIEVLLRKHEGKFTGWIGYMLSRTERKFEEVNDGQWFPYRYDRRHDVNLMLNYRLNTAFNLSAMWVFATGTRGTIARSVYDYYTPRSYPDKDGSHSIGRTDVIHFGDRNAFRMPDYHRLDLAISWKKRGRKFTHGVTAGAYNIYARENPFYYRLDIYGIGTNPAIRYTPVNLFSIVPNINYKFKF